MNINNSTQPYMRTMAQVGVGRQWSLGIGQRFGKFPLSVELLKSVGKVLLLLLPLVLAANMYVVSSIDTVNAAIVVVDNRRYELMDKNIELRAIRGQLRMPGNIQQLAAEKLSLYPTEKNQVGRFNRRTGIFTYL